MDFDDPETQPEKYVRSELADNVPTIDIIQALEQQFGMSPKDAEALVEKIEDAEVLTARLRFSGG